MPSSTANTKSRSRSSYNWKYWAQGTGARPGGQAKKPPKGIHKYYGVRTGRVPGIYNDWREAERQVKDFPGGLHKSFDDIREALIFVGQQDTSVEAWKKIDAFPNHHQSEAWNAYRDYHLEMTTVHRANDARQVEIDIIGSGVERPLDTMVNPDKPLSAALTIAAQEAEPALTRQQSDILSRILKGHNFFFTGSAGTGKSVLLRAIIKAFRQNHDLACPKVLEDKTNTLPGGEGGLQGMGVEVKQTFGGGADARGKENARSGPGKKELKSVRWKLAVTASTGMAGVNIGGSTLHSWAGVGLGKLDAEVYVENFRSGESLALERWLTTGALIIDEVSMIDGSFLDKLDYIGRKLRHDPRPFGGIQIILSGDFYQLPPVGDPDINGKKIYKFAFEANCWNAMIPRENIVSLTRVFRQKDDRFIKILEGMRKGHVGEDDMRLLKTLGRALQYDDGIEAVQLRPIKKQVEDINRERLNELKTPLRGYMACDLPGVDSKGRPVSQDNATKRLDSNTTWPQKLTVKVGAAVMLLINLNVGGLVNGSLGKVIDFVTLPQATERNIQIAPAFHAVPSLTQAWPLVEFIPHKHASKEQLGRGGNIWLIPNMRVEVTNAQGNTEAERYQVPLMLAWALTIHKAQGQTLERVKIDLGSAFTDGQSYVAISRATSLDGLELRNFSYKSVMASQRVLDWALPIEEAQKAEEEWDNIMANYDMDAPSTIYGQQ